MKFLIARHGQTEFNRQGRILGQGDSALTAAGLAGAERLAQVLEPLALSRVVSSPLGRARSTAGILTRGRELKIESAPALAELSAGEWEGLPRQAVLGRTPTMRPGWEARPPGGESYADGQARLEPFLESLSGEDGPILLVGHHCINRVVLKLLLDLGPDLAAGVVCPHETIYVIEGKEVTRLEAGGRAGVGLLFGP